MSINFHGSKMDGVGCSIMHMGRSLLRVRNTYFRERISHVQRYMGSYHRRDLPCRGELNNRHNPFAVAAPGYQSVVGIIACDKNSTGK